MTQKITTFLSYNTGCEEAAELYIATFGNGKITSRTKGPDGGVFSVVFELFGQTYYAMNGGPSFTFSSGTSLFVACETQDEIDRYWAKLTADGGKEVMCGWCTDKFGVSWQIIPADLGSMLGNSDRAKAGRAQAAMMRMKKLDIAQLRAAFEGQP